MGMSQEFRTCFCVTSLCECGQCHWASGSQDLGVKQLSPTILLMPSLSEEPHGDSFLKFTSAFLVQVLLSI